MGKDYKDIGKGKRLPNGQAFGGREKCNAVDLTHARTWGGGGGGLQG